MPEYENILDAATLICGATADCTQPFIVSSLRLAVEKFGMEFTTGFAGILLVNLAGSRGLKKRAMEKNVAVRTGLEKILIIKRRLILSTLVRPILFSMCGLPISIKSPYLTPEGHVVSQDRQVRHRSKCLMLAGPDGFPSKKFLIK